MDTEICRRFPNLVAIPGAGVSAVVPWRFGAWPTNSPGLYGEDLPHIQQFIKASRGDALRQYIDKYVYSWETQEEYLETIGQDNIGRLADDPSRVLSEAFRDWVYPPEKLAPLMPD